MFRRYRNFIWEGTGNNIVLPFFSLYGRDIKVNEGFGVDLDEFIASFAIYRFTLGYYYTETHDHLEPKKLATATLSATFSMLEDNVALSMIVFSQTDAMIAINSSREVIRDFVL